MQDLLVSLNHNKWTRVVHELEDRVNTLFQCRHMHPIWPAHNDPLDAYEQEIHRPIQKIYYDSTKILIDALREIKYIHG